METHVKHRTALLCLWAILAIMALVGAAGISAQHAYADDTQAQSDTAPMFTVAVVGQNSTYVLEPTLVEYGEGDTIKQALEAADLGFGFSSTGMIDSVAGVEPESGAYMYYFTNYDDEELIEKTLDAVPASHITSLFISSANVGILGAGHMRLLDAVGTFMSRSDGLRNYPDASSAYTRCIEGLPTATDAQAQTLGDDFQAAIEAYDGIMGAPKRTVSFTVKRDGAAVADAVVNMVDIYGNSTQAVHAGNGIYEAQVVPLDYSYSAMSADGLDGVRCSLMRVSDNKAIDVQMPAEEWFRNVNLRMRKNGSNTCPQDREASARKLEDGAGVLYTVPDAVLPTTDLAVYAIPTDSVNVDAKTRAAYPFYIDYTGTDGKSYTTQIPYASTSYCPQYLVDTNAVGAAFSYQIRHMPTDDVFTYQVQICNAAIERSPTLTGLSVREGGTELLSGFAPYTQAYDVYTAADELTFAPQMRGTADDGYTATVDGADAQDPVAVSTPASGKTKEVNVEVALNGHAASYTVNVHRVDAAEVTLSHAAGVTVEVANDAGGIVAPQSASDTATSYRLLAGRPYTYTATKDTYYHSRLAFTAQEGETVDVATPHAADVVDSFALGQDNLWGKGASAKPLFEEAEGSAGHDLRFIVPDYWSSQSWVRAYLKAPAAANSYSYTVEHRRQDTGVALSKSITPGTVSGEVDKRISGSLPGFTTAGGYANTATFTVTMGTDSQTGATLFEHYDITALRKLTLPSIAASDGANQLKLVQIEGYGENGEPLYDEDAPTYGFGRNLYDYAIPIAAGAESIRVSFAFPYPVSDTDKGAGGYSVVLDGVETPYEPGGVFTQEVALDPEGPRDQVIALTVRHADESTPDATYRITVRQMPKVDVSFSTSPADASVTVSDVLTGNRVFTKTEGVYSLIQGYTYSYTVAARGYIGQKGTFLASDGVDPSIVLEPAPVNPSIDPSIESGWPYFRADADNNSVVSDATPIDPDDTLMYWATRLGIGYDAGAAGCPILVDGYLYSYAGDQIFKVDVVSGEVVAAGTMVGTSSFAITPMTYAEGMVFVALSNGRIEAFNAATLESLWVYTSPNGGQPNCPITYHDGLIYTGFWNWSNVCDFVCLTVTDEDPATPGSGVVDDPAHPGRVKSVVLDPKVALWSYPHAGGFYWAGAWAGDNFVLVGSDDAGITAGLDINDEALASGTVLSLDPLTGEVIDQLKDDFGVNVGNIRSTIMRDSETGRFYWCARGGYLCGASVNPDGTFDRGSLQCIRLHNDASDGAVSATSTPVIYNGRAYVGADHGSYNAYDGQSVDVVDLNTSTVAYKIDMQGRAQSTGLLTTAYVGDDGYMYLYYFDNYSPGKLRYFKDKPGQTAAVGGVAEQYGGTTYNVAQTLFCPQGAQAQYCICSPISDENGFIYFKNDTAFMMAVGPAIDRLEVVAKPRVTIYGRGDTFDPAGMKVEAVYTNGTRRDVTDYVTYSADEFTEYGKTSVEIVFPYTMYSSPSSSTDIGAAPDYNFAKPKTSVEVEVRGQVVPTVTTMELPRASVGKLYAVQLTASGYPREFTWSCEGTLPDGLSFDGDAGVIGGSPKKGSGGVYTLKIKAANAAGESEEMELALEVDEAPSITAPKATALPAARTGEEYSCQFEAKGYPEPFTFATQEGYESIQGWKSHTPAGLSMDPDTGLLSGTPLEPGTFHLRVYAMNSEGMATPKAYTITVDGESLLPPEGAPGIETELLGTPAADGSEAGYVIAGETVELPLTVVGSPAPEVTVEGLPAGLSYDADAGAIVGVPTVPDEEGKVIAVSADNGKTDEPATRNFLLRVYDKPKVVTTRLDAATRGKEFSQPLQITGTPAPRVTVTGLPSGLRYNSTAGLVYGTPTMAGSYTVTVRASNEAGETIGKLSQAVSGAPSIATTSVPQAKIGVFYSVDLGITGYPVPTVTVEGLPAGLSYNEDSHSIQGTPEQLGAFTVSVSAQNASGERASRTYELSVVDTLVLLTQKLPRAVKGYEYSAQLEFNKDASELESVAVGGLPDGLLFDAEALAITGVPEAEGSYDVQIAASTANAQVETALELIVSSDQEPASARAELALAPWKVGVASSVSLETSLRVTGRPAVFAFTLAEGSVLPDGVVLASDGTLSGTPSRSGAYEFDVLCTNGVGDPVRSHVKLNVAGPVSLEAPAKIPTGIVGDAYVLELVAGGFPAPTFTWEAASGSMLPPGLVLDGATGRISGVPTAGGTFRMTVFAENGTSTAQTDLSITIRANIAGATIAAVPDQVYTGSAICPTLTITVPSTITVQHSLGAQAAAAQDAGAGTTYTTMATTRTLVAGTDYTVAWSNNTAVGTAKAVITGKGSFAGTNAVEFKIVPRSLESATVTGIVNKTYTGKAQTQAPAVKFTLGPKTTLALKAGTDYALSYANNVNAGTAKVTITGKGNFTDSVTWRFSIAKAANPFKVKAKAAKVKYNKKKATTLKASKYVKVTNNKSKGKVTYKKKSGDKKVKVAKNGKLKVAKGAKRGKHKLVVAVTTAAKGNYKKTTKYVKVTIKVK